MYGKDKNNAIVNTGGLPIMNHNSVATRFDELNLASE